MLGFCPKDLCLWQWRAGKITGESHVTSLDWSVYVKEITLELGDYTISAHCKIDCADERGFEIFYIPSQ